MTKKTTLKELGEMLEHVVKHMATKDDIAELKTTLDEHSKILADHTRDIAGLSAKIDRIDTNQVLTIQDLKVLLPLAD
jgi:hypothetical protein